MSLDIGFGRSVVACGPCALGVKGSSRDARSIWLALLQKLALQLACKTRAESH